jgi:hypothetical protein
MRAWRTKLPSVINSIAMMVSILVTEVTIVFFSSQSIVYLFIILLFLCCSLILVLSLCDGVITNIFFFELSKNAKIRLKFLFLNILMIKLSSTLLVVFFAVFTTYHY